VFGKLNTNYGLAGPIYIEYVLKNMPQVRRLLVNMQNKIDEELQLDQADRF
jgi:hypothetical protein